MCCNAGEATPEGTRHQRPMVDLYIKFCLQTHPTARNGTPRACALGSGQKRRPSRSAARVFGVILVDLVLLEAWLVFLNIFFLLASMNQSDYGRGLPDAKRHPYIERCHSNDKSCDDRFLVPMSRWKVCVDYWSPPFDMLNITVYLNFSPRYFTADAVQSYRPPHAYNYFESGKHCLIS